jgi:hypothetical protein
VPWNSDDRLWEIRDKFIAAEFFVDDADLFNREDIDNLKMVDFKVAGIQNRQ